MNMKTYTITEGATILYNTALDIFDWNQTSDCVTPMEVAQSQFRGVPTTGELCIPGAGIGTYVVAALQAGFLPENITAVELDPMYYELGSGMFDRFGVNYVHADFLTLDPSMKFDVIIGNPPYQKGGNSAFYTMFLRKIGELLKPGGYFSQVTPSKAAAMYTKGYKELAKTGWNRVEYGLDSSFPNIGQPIAIFSGFDKTNPSETLTVVDGDNQIILPRNSVLPVQYISPTKKFTQANSSLTLSIFQKFYNSTNKKVKDRYQTLDVPPTGSYVYLSTVAWGYHPSRPKGGPYAFLCHLNSQDDYYAAGSRGKFMLFKTNEQAEQMFWLLSRSYLYRFVVAASCRAQFLPRVLLEETPDWLGVTTDEELYAKVGLTPDEINYINLWNTETAGNTK